MTQAAFYIGQVVHHKLFGYRGVVYDADPVFLGSDEWYEQVAQSRPPKDQPWYHVLVDGHSAETYVAERNLEPDESAQPIEHPNLEAYFQSFEGGAYQLRMSTN